MDEGIFYSFFAIAEAILNFLVYTPFKFMLFALLFIGALIYSFAFRIKDKPQLNLKISSFIL